MWYDTEHDVHTCMHICRITCAHVYVCACMCMCAYASVYVYLCMCCMHQDRLDTQAVNPYGAEDERKQKDEASMQHLKAVAYIRYVTHMGFVCGVWQCTSEGWVGGWMCE